MISTCLGIAEAAAKSPNEWMDPMITSNFDTIARTASRRGLVSGVSATMFALAAAHLPFAVEAKQKHKHHKKKKRNKGQGAAPPPPAPESPPPPPDPVTRRDATCTEEFDDQANLLASGEQAQVAQTFTALASGRLVSARLRIVKEAGSAGSYNLRVAPVDGAGFPVNDILTDAVVANGDVSDGLSTVEFTFNAPFSVVAGTAYALVLTRPGGNEITVKGRVGNPCGGGAFTATDLNAPFVAVDDFDISFVTFVMS
jgi:hypothetical protein